MKVKPSNISLNGEPVDLELTSPHIVLIDPLALDGCCDAFQTGGDRSLADWRSLLRELSEPLRIGLHVVEHFQPGGFRVALEDFEPVDEQVDPRAVDVDTGAIVLADLAHLDRVAQVVTWERYDLALQAPADDYTPFVEMSTDVGGPHFALMFCSADTPFDGDGAFRLRHGAPAPIK